VDNFRLVATFRAPPRATARTYPPPSLAPPRFAASLPHPWGRKKS